MFERPVVARVQSWLVVIVAILLAAAGLTIAQLPVTETVRAASLATEFGVVGAVPSFTSDNSKQQAIDKIAEAGFGWMRHEFDYNNPMSFEHYDAAHNKAKAKGIKTLGLLLYIGSDKSHDDWKNYVRSVVSHYGSDIPAWEIMNEADNYLSSADYVVYLKEARDIIKEINPAAIVVLTGITSRPETPNFWNGVAAADGWSAFDVAGLHVYHDGNPEKVNFGGGDLSAEFDRASAALKKNGGGKKIWITETGFATVAVGADNQADWLARNLILGRANSNIEKIFVYRLTDDNKATYGLMGSDFSERPSYGRVKAVISNLAGANYGTRLYPSTKQSLDGLEAINGWTTKATTNGTANLSTVAGKTGNAMKIEYNFTADKAYAVAEKDLPVDGQPEAFAAWFYGDDTKNVWKYRFKDAKAETFQADLGNLVSGWNYKQFTIGQDVAYVSWDGDGVIDYPIKFTAVVVDRQGGEAVAGGMVDEIIAVTGGADLQAYQFGSDKIVYWKVSGPANAELCGARRDFSPTPAYASGVNCVDTSKPAAPVSVTSPDVSPKPAASAKAVTPTPLPSPSPSSAPSPSPILSPTPAQTPLIVVEGQNKSTAPWVIGLIVFIGLAGGSIGWFYRRRGSLPLRFSWPWHRPKL